MGAVLWEFLEAGGNGFEAFFSLRHHVAPCGSERGCVVFVERGVTIEGSGQREPRWLRAIILLGLAILGSGIAYVLSGGFVREGVVQLSNFPIWLLLVFAFGCGLVVGAFAVIFAIRKTPEVRDLTRLEF